MRNLLIIAGVLTATLATPAFALDKVTPKEQAYFKNLEVKLWDAWNERLKPSDAAKFYSQDPKNLYFDLSPLKFTGWAEYEKVATKALSAGGHATTKIDDDFTVIKNGDLVVTAFTFETNFFGAQGGPGMAFHGRETDVWTKEGGKWLIVHQHMSTPSGGGGGGPTQKPE